MAFKCVSCGKGISWGHRVSHAKNRSNHMFRPNIQKKKILIGTKMVSVKICTNCIKTLKKVKKEKAPKIIPAPALV